MLFRSEGKKELPVMIGYDRRFLSAPAAKWIAEVFAANDVNCLFMGRSAPTPLVMFTVKHEKLHYGVEVTASHNPFDYNGIRPFWYRNLPPATWQAFLLFLYHPRMRFCTAAGICETA